MSALPAGHGTQPGLVLVHFGQRHHAADRHQVAASYGFRF